MSAPGMPPNMMAYFQPRTSLEYMPPVTTKSGPTVSSCAEYVKFFTDDPPPPILPFETPKERRARKKKEKIEAHNDELLTKIDDYEPNADEKSTSDPFATLFISRINYGTNEKKLKKEFEAYGPIKKIRMIKDEEGKPRGYAFLEFESDKDMKEAYKRSDGLKLDGRRLLVDVERGRVVSGWLPRRLGGGRGTPRYIAPKSGKGPAVGPPGPAMEEQRDDRMRYERPDRRNDRKDRDYSTREKDRDREKERHRDRDRRKSRSRSRSKSRSRERRHRSPRRRDRDSHRDSHRDSNRESHKERR